jgi:CheY-like chemotaxis protein
MEEDLRKSREAGFVEHLTKPVDFEQLEAVIQQLTAV